MFWLWYADFGGVCRYEADHVYALATVYFCCAVIGVFAISNLLVRYSPDWVKRTPVWRGFTSVSRYLSYRGYGLPKVRYWTPSLGVILLGLIGTAFFLGTKLITSNLVGCRSWLAWNRIDSWINALLLADRCKLWKQSAHRDSGRMDGPCIATVCAVGVTAPSMYNQMLTRDIGLWVSRPTWFPC